MNECTRAARQISFPHLFLSLKKKIEIGGFQACESNKNSDREYDVDSVNVGWSLHDLNFLFSTDFPQIDNKVVEECAALLRSVRLSSV